MRTRTSSPPHRLFEVADLPEPMRVRNCDDLLEAIQSIFQGWSLREVEAHPRTPYLRIARTRDGAYRRISREHDTPSAVREKTRKTLVAALCGFHFELIDWYAQEHPDQLFIHGAAVKLGDRLVVLPATMRAGKSTLCVYLAMLGAQVYCDDVLPIDLGRSARDFMREQMPSADIEWHEFPIGHEVSVPEIEIVAAWFAKRFG